MTLDRLAPAILMLAAMVVVLVLVFGEARRLRRVEAGTAERKARPHSVNVGTAIEDATAIARGALTEQLHHDTKEGHAA